MSGSIHYFQYTSDAGVPYHIRMDKSNALLVGNQQLSSINLPGIPRNIEPRHVIYRSADGKVSRKIWIGANTANIITTLPTQITDPYIQATGSTPLYISAIVPERTKLPKIIDTVQTT